MPSFDAKWLRLLLMASFATASRPFRSARSMGVHHFTARGVGVRCAEQDVSWEFDAEAPDRGGDASPPRGGLRGRAPIDFSCSNLENI